MKIVVLAGGTSTERDVSLITGKMVYHALKENGHQVVLLDVFMGYDEGDCSDIFALQKDWAETIEAIGESDPDIEAIKQKRGGSGFFGPNVIDICHQADIVFMGLHGENGEDGRVQAALDLEGIKYTGTGPLGAAVSMDKGLSKQIFSGANIPTPQGYTLKMGDKLPDDVMYPAVVKACNGGSSVGVYMVKDAAECEKAIVQAQTYDSQVIVEQYIKGREFSVGVIEGKALPIIEIAPLEGFYDYKNKYQAGSAIETCPAELSEELTLKMQDYAQKVFEALHIESYARIDFMMNEDGEMFCLEANTLPGMTPTSLLPQEAKEIGYDFNKLCEWLIEVSLRKYE
ncbi:MAG: D-alanine--D-alanine ligase [Lachnospiraceae bacterium]|nr:D-alanine--D-alanine ligase [Lachnospiraceae bacterium]